MTPEQRRRVEAMPDFTAAGSRAREDFAAIGAFVEHTKRLEVALEEIARTFERNQDFADVTTAHEMKVLARRALSQTVKAPMNADGSPPWKQAGLSGYVQRLRVALEIGPSVEVADADVLDRAVDRITRVSELRDNWPKSNPMAAVAQQLSTKPLTSAQKAALLETAKSKKVETTAAGGLSGYISGQTANALRRRGLLQKTSDRLFLELTPAGQTIVDAMKSGGKP